MSTGQRVRTADGPGWFFEAGAESLDFAYALGALPGARAIVPVDSPGALGAWLADRVPRLSPEDAGGRDLEDARALAVAVARLATARADGRFAEPDDVDALNLVAALPDLPPVLPGGGRQAGTLRVRAGQALSTLARDAIRVLAEDEARLRRCAADDCRLLFHDESRTRSRRWCSMQRCGNRAKVRAHRARASATR